MVTELERRSIPKYFKPFPKLAVFLIILGLPLLFLYGAGLLLIILGIIWAMSWKRKPSDSDMDRYVREEIEIAKSKSLLKASVDRGELVGASVAVTGPRLWNRGGATLLHKKGNDGILRFTPINLGIIHMTQHQLISYHCSLDLITGNRLIEQTDEFFYKDVVSVATKTKSYQQKLDSGQVVQLNQAETFVLTTSGGTSVEITLSDPKLIEVMGGGSLPTTDAEKAINVVRKMLREKKQI